MAIVRDFKIGLIMLDFISIRLAKCETLAKYCNHKHCRWLSGDPALNDYIPKAPINDEAKKDNENLPGMGGIYNTVNLSVYHYAGIGQRSDSELQANNPVKYIDPDGRTTKVTITNKRVASLSEKFIADHNLIGFGTMYIIYTNSKSTQASTYLVTVTDDKTNTTSYYEVTRNAPKDSDLSNLAFNPKEAVGKYYGFLRDGGNGVGEVLELWNDKSGTDRNIRADITGDGEPDYIQIHVGGEYINTKDNEQRIGGSLGCFGLNGRDSGNAGRDKFMKDIRQRLNNSGGRIEIYVQRLDN
jgi:YD repeat protein